MRMLFKFNNQAMQRMCQLKFGIGIAYKIKEQSWGTKSQLQTKPGQSAYRENPDVASPGNLVSVLARRRLAALAFCLMTAACASGPRAVTQEEFQALRGEFTLLKAEHERMVLSQIDVVIELGLIKDSLPLASCEHNDEEGK